VEFGGEEIRGTDAFEKFGIRMNWAGEMSSSRHILELVVMLGSLCLGGITLASGMVLCDGDTWKGCACL